MADAVPFVIRRAIGRAIWVRRVARSMPSRLSKKVDTRNALKKVSSYPAICAKSRHSLPGELVVSLTSYPKRFGVLDLTIKSLLDQTVVPDRLVLWIAEKDIAHLPESIRLLEKDGLEIHVCEDLRSYKKIIPSLSAWPSAFVVTVDDDVYYEPTWLATLTQEFESSRPQILCRRAHRVARRTDGEMLPYQHWDRQIIDLRPSKESIFPTGVGGVLYYPGSLHREVMNKASFLEICKNADDVWLYWMGRMAGSEYRQVGNYFVSIEWPSSQMDSLYAHNTTGNDAQIRAMRIRYGKV